MFAQLLVTFLLAASPDAPKPKADLKITDTKAVEDLSGVYLCAGKENTKKYSGVVIMRRHSDVYIVQWATVGGPAYTGVGVRLGEVLAVSWSIATKDGGRMTGTNVYKITHRTAGPLLEGRWATLPSDGRVSHETLTFLRPLEDDGPADE